LAYQGTEMPRTLLWKCEFVYGWWPLTQIQKGQKRKHATKVPIRQGPAKKSGFSLFAQPKLDHGSEKVSRNAREM